MRNEAFFSLMLKAFLLRIDTESYTRTLSETRFGCQISEDDAEKIFINTFKIFIEAHKSEGNEHEDPKGIKKAPAKCQQFHVSQADVD